MRHFVKRWGGGGGGAPNDHFYHIGRELTVTLNEGQARQRLHRAEALPLCPVILPLGKLMPSFDYLWTLIYMQRQTHKIVGILALAVRETFWKRR